MRDVLLSDVQRLKPGIRLAFLEGRQKYRDQIGDVQIKDDQVMALLKSGQLKHWGGQNPSGYAPSTFLADTIQGPHKTVDELVSGG